MSKNLITTVLQISGKEDNEITRLKIEAELNRILSYLNRTEVTDEMFPVVCLVIAECINNDTERCDNIQSLSEGDMSVTYSANSPFFGKLESFKVIRGIK